MSWLSAGSWAVRSWASSGSREGGCRVPRRALDPARSGQKDTAPLWPVAWAPSSRSYVFQSQLTRAWLALLALRVLKQAPWVVEHNPLGQSATVHSAPLGGMPLLLGRRVFLHPRPRCSSGWRRLMQAEDGKPHITLPPCSQPSAFPKLLSCPRPSLESCGCRPASLLPSPWCTCPLIPTARTSMHTCTHNGERTLCCTDQANLLCPYVRKGDSAFTLQG